MTPQDILAAGSDAIALAMGARSVGLHPFAAKLVDSPLSSVARAAALLVRPAQSYEQDMAIVSRGIGTAEFSKALADAAQVLVLRRYDAQAAHRAFCGEIVVNDFRQTSLPHVDTGLELPLIDNCFEFAQGTAVVGEGRSVALRTYGRVLNFRRELVVNDQLGAIKDVITNLGSAAARTEAALVCSALESDAHMDDGELPFHNGHGNLVAEGFSETSLGAAMAALRQQKTPGENLSDLAAAHLVVAADLEFLAKKINHVNGLALTVTAMAGLPPGRWYLIADPAQAQTICTLTLFGSRPVGIEQHRRDVQFDGAAVRARADLGACLASRIGIVRGGL